MCKRSNYVMVLWAFVLLLAPKIWATKLSCELSLTPNEKTYIRVLYALENSGMLSDQDRLLMSQGQVIDPLKSRSVKAKYIYLQRVLTDLAPQLKPNPRLQEELIQVAAYSDRRQVQAETGLRITRDFFAPQVVHSMHAAFNNSETHYFWYRTSNNELSLAIQQRSGLRFHIVDPERGTVVEKSPPEPASQATYTQSRFFLYHKRLMIIYERSQSHQLVLYDVQSGEPIYVDASFAANELTIIETGRRRYVMATAGTKLQIFAVRANTLLPSAVIEAEYNLQDARPFVTNDGNVRVVAHDTNHIYVYEPLKSASAIIEPAWKCGDASANDWIKGMEAGRTANGELVAAAITQGPDLGIRLQIVRENGLKQVVGGLELQKGDKTIPMQMITTAQGDLILATIENNRLVLRDPLNAQAAVVVEQGWFTSLSWLRDGEERFLAFSQKSAKGQIKRRVIKVKSVQDFASVAEFDDTEAGGEHHVRMPIGQWLYVASSYNRSWASDGVNVTPLVPQVAHPLSSSAPVAASPGEFYVAVSSGTFDMSRNNLRIIRLTSRLSNLGNR